MRAATLLLNWATDLAFLALAIYSFNRWNRRRRADVFDFAVAVGLLAVVSLIGRVTPILPQGARSVLSDVSLVGFLASAYALLRFRSDFIPLARVWHVVAIVGLGAAGVLAILYLPPGGSSARPTQLQEAVILALILAWCVCVIEPVVRFFLAARGRPHVQRRRLQALGLGYLLIVVILVIAVSIGSAAQSQPFQLAIAASALLSVPLIYVGFSPPSWLRRQWREAEAEAYRTATRDLLIFSPTRLELAQRATDWAVRLTGGEYALIADANEEVLAATGTSPENAKALLKQVPLETEEPVELPGRSTAIRLPLMSPGAGTGALVLVSGPFTPLFGSDEIGVLRAYAVNTAAGLDRASLTERLSALERTKTEFLNLASHELRGPLTVIRGYLAMLAEGSLGELPDTTNEVLPVLLSKADQMNRLVEQMLEASRLEEGRLELAIESADLRDLVQSAIEESRPLADPKHPVKLAAPADAVPVEVDRQRITTIVTNLISNAIKYSPAGGEVECAVSVDNHATVSVRDRGVGIAPDDVRHLFTRFGRIANPETRGVPGTGLGLYLSRELARLHGGELTVNSQPGEGSTFTLRLPLARNS